MQDDGDARHPLHDEVEVIGNDAAKGFHCAGKDVAIDAHHVLRLLELDVHVFHHFGVKKFGIGVDGFDARYECFIAADTRVEVHEALLQVAQFKQVVVAKTSLKPVFGVIDGDVDLLQEFQKPHCRRHDEAQNKGKFIVDGIAFGGVVLHKVVDNDILEIAEHNHQIAIGDNAERHGGKRDIGVAGFARYAHNGEHPIVVTLHARAFVRVTDIGDKRVGHTQAFHIVDIVLSGVANVDPAAILPLVHLFKSFSKKQKLFHNLDTASLVSWVGCRCARRGRSRYYIQALYRCDYISNSLVKL